MLSDITILIIFIAAIGAVAFYRVEIRINKLQRQLKR